MKHFMASLCKNGILGGWILTDTDRLTYRTGKLTVPDAYKNLQIAYQDIEAVTKGGFFPFPTVTFKLKNGESHKFIIFARKRFLNTLQAAKTEVK